LLKKILYLILLCSNFCIAQENNKYIPFKSLNYSPTNFNINADTINFEQVKIIITMVKPLNNFSGSLCESWLTIMKNGKVMEKKYYDIEPVGGCSGLFLPETQPLEDYFIISKFGDYDGQTLLIDKNGHLTELKGGSFSISVDKKFLFSIWNSDIDGLTIYDVKEQRVMFNEENELSNHYEAAYFQKGKYYLSMHNSPYLSQIDVKKGKLIRGTKSKESLIQSNKLYTYNHYQNLPLCNCGLD
jgi:hypothetical protein